MKKVIVTLLLGYSISWAGLINGIALTVNDDPITLYDIDKEMQEKHINKNQAAKKLIDGLIYQQEVKKNKINVDIFDIDNYIAKLAAQNHMKSLEFKSLVRQQQDYNKFLDAVKKQLTHQKLIRKVAGGKIKIATDEDLKIYYDNHKEEFNVPSTLEVTAYVSKSKIALEQKMANPMINDNRVMMQDISFKYDELNPQVKYLLQTTKTKEFTPIFAQNNNYNMFYVKDKLGVKQLPFSEVKEKIFQVLMEQRETNFLNEYFETQKMTAKIKVYR